MKPAKMASLRHDPVLQRLQQLALRAAAAQLRGGQPFRDQPLTFKESEHIEEALAAWAGRRKQTRTEESKEE